MRSIGLAGIIIFSTLALSGCGGGGSTSVSTPDTPPQQGTQTTQPVTAVLKLSTQGSLGAGVAIGAIDVVVNLPPGVTVKSDGSGQALAGAVEPSAVATGSTAIATFTPPAGGSPAKTRVVLINATGFSAGEFATVNCDITAGSSPKPSDFTLTGFNATNVDGAPLTALTPVFNADIK